KSVDEKEHGWPSEVCGPSAIAFDDGWIVPKELTVEEIKEITNNFVKTAKLALKAGFDFVEIHGAHGYLISSFLSSTSNQRTDQYGGSFENRIRLLLDVVKNVRAVWPKQKPLAVRLSCDEWYDNKGWNIDDTVKLVRHLIDLGVDMIDCSSGGNNPKQKIAIKPGYQVHFAEKVKSTYGNKVTVGAVGLLTEPQQCNNIIKNKQADVVLLARQLLRDPNFVLNAAAALNADISHPPQYQRWLGRL
ncbi:oxidoreductase, partial [Reticulomyxa filosa]